LEKILADHPGHPTATKLLAELDAAQAAETLVDAGVGADAGDGAGDGMVAETETEPAIEPATVTESEAGDETVTGEETVAGDRTEVGEETEAGAVAKTGSEAESVKEAPTPRARRTPAYDEYDRLAKAAGSDEFVDGRPPVRGYDWYMQQGRDELAAENFPRARAYFDSALEARPGSAEAMDGLGDVMTALEDYISAARYFRVAAQRGHPDGYFNLGRTYERLGRDQEAVSAYFTYAKRRPSGTHAGAAIAAIKRLEPRAKLPPELDPDSEPGAKPEPPPADAPKQDSGTTTP
jgi:tetratricopeptide (TPR) repeat protein